MLWNCPLPCPGRNQAEAREHVRRGLRVALHEPRVVVDRLYGVIDSRWCRNISTLLPLARNASRSTLASSMSLTCAMRFFQSAGSKPWIESIDRFLVMMYRTVVSEMVYWNASSPLGGVL